MEDEPLHLMIVGPLKEALEQAAIADGRTVDDFVAAKLREAVPSEFASATRKAIDRRSKEEWDRHEKVLSDVLDKHFR